MTNKRFYNGEVFKHFQRVFGYRLRKRFLLRQRVKKLLALGGKR